MPDLVTKEHLGWSTYNIYEGPIFRGRTRYQCPNNPDNNNKILTVITRVESGSPSAINAYDRMIVSAGLIQFGEASYFGVSNLLGGISRLGGPSLLTPLQPAFDMAEATFGPDTHGEWRFTHQGERVTSLDRQHRLFQLHSNGTKGTWDEASKDWIRTWVVCLANVLEQPAAIAAQVEYTIPKLRSFSSGAVATLLWGKDAPQTEDGWPGALRAAYLSFAVNLPAIAAKHCLLGAQNSKATPWSRDWCIDIIKQMTFGPNIAIYPIRYSGKDGQGGIRPALETLYGVDLPDLAEELHAFQCTLAHPDNIGAPMFDTPKEIQQFLIDQGFDLGPHGADGIMGAKTRAAVAAFQLTQHLLMDGLVGPKTVRAMQEIWLTQNNK